MKYSNIIKNASFKDIIQNKIEVYEKYLKGSGRNPILNKNNFNNCLWIKSPSIMIKDIIYQIVSFIIMTGNLNTNKFV